MKKAILFLAILNWGMLKSQVLPDIVPEDPSMAHGYYENKGQIIDRFGTVHNEILYYTEKTLPRIYLEDNKAHFGLSVLDSTDSVRTYRVDMEFVNFSNPTITPSESTPDKLNYYQPHCGDGIEDVAGYSRIVYEDAFPNIDFHWYSNGKGLKAYIVIYPGGDPTDILFRFRGQDSLGVVDSSDLVFYSDSGGLFTFPQTTAYQISSLNTPFSIGVDPEWISLGHGLVGLQVSSYDNTKPLVIRIADVIPTIVDIKRSVTGVQWSTLYGGNQNDGNKDIVLDDNQEITVLSKTNSDVFPAILGADQYDYNNRTDAYLSLFDNNNIRIWATYYGGSEMEDPSDIALDRTSNYVYIIGNTGSADLPMPTTNNGIFKQTTYNGGIVDAFISGFDNVTGKFYWTSYFGGDQGDEGKCIDVKTIDGHLHIFIGGITNANTFTSNCSPGVSQFPICNAAGYGYYQDYNNGDGDIFLAEFDDTRDLIWSSLFGGESEDAIYDIAVNTDGEVHIIGSTSTTTIPAHLTSPYTPVQNGEFPLADPGGSSFVQSVNSGTDAFVAKFDDHKNLIWSTFYGGNDIDGFTSVALNSNNDIYIIGGTSSDNVSTGCSALNNGDVIVCNGNGVSFNQPFNGSSIHGPSDALILRFSSSGQLKWSTFYGGESDEDGNDIFIDPYDRLFIVGTTGDQTGVHSPPALTIDGVSYSGLYYQRYNASESESIYWTDCYIAGFNSLNQIQWATYFGGNDPNDNGTDANELGMAIAANKNNLFLVGTTYTSTTPLENPLTTNCYYDDIRDFSDGFITKFELSSYTVGITPITKPQTNLSVYPNPTNTKLNIDLSILKQGTVSLIQLFDSEGKLINVNCSSKDGILSLNVDSLSTGIYMIQIISETGTYFGKFIKN